MDRPGAYPRPPDACGGWLVAAEGALYVSIRTPQTPSLPAGPTLPSGRERSGPAGGLDTKANPRNEGDGFLTGALASFLTLTIE
jgi:hypothetical protein